MCFDTLIKTEKKLKLCDCAENYLIDRRQEAAAERIEMSLLKEDERYLVFQGKKLVREEEERETYGDTFTIGSTSKDSSEWRSSINCRDSAAEDPFSSSSRRSCPKWESYAVFQKYDEEMLFLDRITAQKLSETGTRLGSSIASVDNNRVFGNISKVSIFLINKS